MYLANNNFVIDSLRSYFHKINIAKNALELTYYINRVFGNKKHLRELICIMLIFQAVV